MNYCYVFHFTWSLSNENTSHFPIHHLPTRLIREMKGRWDYVLPYWHIRQTELILSCIILYGKYWLENLTSLSQVHSPLHQYAESPHFLHEGALCPPQFVVPAMCLVSLYFGDVTWFYHAQYGDKHNPQSSTSSWSHVCCRSSTLPLFAHSSCDPHPCSPVHPSCRPSLCGHAACPAGVQLREQKSWQSPVHH